MRDPGLLTNDWITIIGAMFLSAISGTVYLFTNFETKGEAQSIEQRLVRIEEKVDRLLEGNKR